MARKITLFELHFDGARFGPSIGSASEDEESGSMDGESEYEEEATEEESGGSRLRPVLAIAGVILLVVAARRLNNRRKSEDEYGIEIDEDAEAVPAE